MKHIPVLKEEAIKLLNVEPNGLYLDLTLGRAGHASEILKRLKTGKLIAFDLDINAIKESNEILKKINNRYELIHDNFKNFDSTLKERGIDKVDGILLDLGVSSPQFDDPSRGFSYQTSADLDMRMNQDQKLTAKYVVNHYSLNELTNIFRNYGEEKDAYSIAKNIVLHREKQAINTTLELVNIIKLSKRKSELLKKGHPAKQVFQALRIAVNDELNNLKEVIGKALKYLNINGRLVIITFHSLEDRIVKNEFNKVTKEIGNRIDEYNLPTNNIKQFALINKKVILPSEEEINLNHRSKSAKMRGIMKIN